MPEFGGRTYKAVLGSDVSRDGMYLEVANGTGEVIAEVLYSDTAGDMTLSTFGSSIGEPALAAGEFALTKRLSARSDR
jgi:hypothetical protein